jgi:hypothetical protein
VDYAKEAANWIYRNESRNDLILVNNELLSRAVVAGSMDDDMLPFRNVVRSCSSHAANQAIPYLPLLIGRLKFAAVNPDLIKQRTQGRHTGGLRDRNWRIAGTIRPETERVPA